MIAQLCTRPRRCQRPRSRMRGVEIGVYRGRVLVHAIAAAAVTTSPWRGEAMLAAAARPARRRARGRRRHRRAAHRRARRCTCGSRVGGERLQLAAEPAATRAEVDPAGCRRAAVGAARAAARLLRRRRSPRCRASASTSRFTRPQVSRSHADVAAALTGRIVGLRPRFASDQLVERHRRVVILPAVAGVSLATHLADGPVDAAGPDQSA